MRPLIIQQAINHPHESMLELTRPIHQAYCRRHGFNYLTLFGHAVEPKSHQWNKIKLILMALEDGVKEIVWLDADSVIVDPSVNLTDAIPKDPDCIGMVAHKRWEPHHLNCGVIYLKSTNESHAFFNTVWDSWIENDATWKGQPWHDQSVIMKIHEEHPIITEIDAKWNSKEDINPSPNPVVVSFHGASDAVRLEMMQKEIEKWYPK